MLMPGVVAELERLREAVRRNEPNRHNPERFHEVKSSITGDLTAVINAVRAGRDVKPKDR